MPAPSIFIKFFLFTVFSSIMINHRKMIAHVGCIIFFITAHCGDVDNIFTAIRRDSSRADQVILEDLSINRKMVLTLS